MSFYIMFTNSKNWSDLSSLRITFEEGFLSK